MENKIQKNNLALQNYETLKDELSQILENQRISKKKQDQILETTQRGFIGIALRNEELLKSNHQLKQQLDDVIKELNTIKQEREEKAARKEAWLRSLGPLQSLPTSRIAQILTGGVHLPSTLRDQPACSAPVPKECVAHDAPLVCWLV